jgi:hypothetical protein
MCTTDRSWYQKRVPEVPRATSEHWNAVINCPAALDMCAGPLPLMFRQHLIPHQSSPGHQTSTTCAVDDPDVASLPQDPGQLWGELGSGKPSRQLIEGGEGLPSPLSPLSPLQQCPPLPSSLSSLVCLSMSSPSLCLHHLTPGADYSIPMIRLPRGYIRSPLFVVESSHP